MVRRGGQQRGGGPAARPAEGGASSGSTVLAIRGRAGSDGTAPAAKKAKRAAKEAATKMAKDYGEDVVALLALLPMMAKLLLQDTQLIRDLASATFTTWFLSRESKVAKAIKAAMVKYNEDCKTAKQGPPHLYAVLALLEAAKGLEWGEAEQPLQAMVITFDLDYEPRAEEEQHRLTPFFRMKKIQKDDVFLVQYKAREGGAEQVLDGIMRKEGATLKTGRAPAGVMERLLSRAVSQLAADTSMDA